MGTAWRIEKDVCYPGRVVVPDDDGNPRVVTFRDADIAAMHRTGNEKIGDGWNVPVCWEHQNVHPLRKAVHLSQAARDREYAKSVFGAAAGFVVRGGRLRAILEGTDPDDLKQFKKVGFVSPEIVWDWRDTDGKVWHGPTITHIAATPRPVQRHQDAVASARLSLAAHARNPAASPRPFVPELSPRVGFTLRLSLTSYAESPHMADDNLNPNGGGDGTDGTGKSSAWDRIKAALASKGVMLGDADIKDENHLADLIEVACLNSADDTMADDDMEPDDEDDAPPEGDLPEPPPGTSEPPPPPVQMSLAKAHEIIISGKRKELIREAQQLTAKGHIPPHVGNDLVSRAKSVRLSLTASGDIEPNPVTNEIAAYQKLDPKSGWSPVGKRKVVGGGAGGKGGKKSARLSQTANGKNRNTREVGRSQFQEDGEADTDSVLAAWDET